ncbi:hypothetical protein EJ066_28390 [Mesorhizobium sp. M9A.F.Ca.ET.002.03.1.2]|uniref:adenylate/guanylate cyclase domain-containing protein n=1 Tax=Mesorhizobium sp. M9A.F.Ca.ET.002.03.1.2 TaxID=2493668 RepID=UPI000F754255|nr:adenylate/guanylate cyclase domain-containing protein [Mesorhizobium sp. M9A.F.Ca.ET.002.03.1.2]AZO00710.1 hypothetical protein EJ066_28390 [Mesorhizobium sp. M9A.F.Ca.ET.002.03.1.2]
MQIEAESPALKAILFADLAQYSRLTAAGELAAIDLVTQCFSLFKDHCPQHRGEFVKTTGDGVLALFDSVSDALNYAVTMQDKLAALAVEQPAAGRFRVGLHMGEIRRRTGDVYGHAVNLAARVQTLATPGSICVTEEVYRAARSTTDYGFRFAGRHALKNMPETMSFYHVIPHHMSQDKPGPSQFSISVMGGLAVLDSDGEPVALRSRTAQALIGYLALSTGFRELRDRIATLLWPERTPAEARSALTGGLRIAAKALSGESKNSGLRHGNHVTLDPARVIVDINRIFTDLSEGKVDDTLLERSDWTEAILYGFESVSSLYGAWLRVTRHNRRNRAEEALESLLSRFDASEPVIRHAASALLMLEPSHEGAARCLMRHHAFNQNVAAARRVYNKLASTLRQDYQLEPSVETTALAASLADPTLPRQPEKPLQGRAPIIAVCTFVSESDAVAAFASGFRSELIINLSKFRELTILDMQDGRDASDADYQLKADCRGLGNQCALFVSLEERMASRVVWSEPYRLTLANWHATQRQLVGRLASNLEIYLSQDRLARALQRLPEDLDVYDTWLRGEHLLLRWSAKAEDEAERLFDQAIIEDATFAPAHASLASVYNSRHFIRPGCPRDAQTQQRALALARRAVELDPLDARNHMVVAWSTAMVQRFEQAELHFELAAELNPSDPKVIVSAALGLAFMGRMDLATKLTAHALELTPLFPDYQWSHLATTRFLAGDYLGTIEAAERSQNVIIDTPGWKAAALGKLGRLEEREAALKELLRAAEAAWAGPANPSRRDIIQWFLGAFPIRRTEDRLKVAASLGRF